MIVVSLSLFFEILNIQTKSSRLGPHSKLLTTISFTNALNLVRLNTKARTQLLEQVRMSRSSARSLIGTHTTLSTTEQFHVLQGSVSGAGMTLCLTVTKQVVQDSFVEGSCRLVVI
jgi:hypothetical protein